MDKLKNKSQFSVTRGKAKHEGNFFFFSGEKGELPKTFERIKKLYLLLRMRRDKCFAAAARCPEREKERITSAQNTYLAL